MCNGHLASNPTCEKDPGISRYFQTTGVLSANSHNSDNRLHASRRSIGRVELGRDARHGLRLPYETSWRGIEAGDYCCCEKSLVDEQARDSLFVFLTRAALQSSDDSATELPQLLESGCQAICLTSA